MKTETAKLIKGIKIIPDNKASKLIAYTRNYELYLMLLPPVIFYLIFYYWPMYGVQIAFKDFNASVGIWGSPWIGVEHFVRFFSFYNFKTILWNTISINLYNLAVGFPMPILLALMINEIKNLHFKKLVQNVTYMPYFLSVVVIVGLLITMTSLRGGIANEIIKALGGQPVNFMIRKEYFKTLYVLTDMWQFMGWNAVIYIAALSGISPELYEAAIVDGATKLQRMIYISIPGIMPTVVVLLILRVGQLLNVGFAKVLLMQNDANLSTSDVISTYIYRSGILDGNFSYATAVGLFNSVCNFTILLIANRLSKKSSGSGLW